MKPLEFSGETKKLITIGDIYVDVDIRFVDRMCDPRRSVEEQICVDKLNSELGMLGFELKQIVKAKINEALTPTTIIKDNLK